MADAERAVLEAAQDEAVRLYGFGHPSVGAFILGALWQNNRASQDASS